MVKIVIICAVAALCGVGALAQNADVALPIPQYAQDSKARDWYIKQLELWKAECATTPTKEGAWYNRFKAQRYAFFGDTVYTQKQRAETFAALFKEMEKAVPNSWEYHLAMWRNGGNNTALYPHLEKAYALNPTFVEVLEEMVTYHEIAMNTAKRNELIKQWYATKALSPALLSYAYNAITTLEPNAVLVTGGDNDTYPFWMLQAAKNIRPDVVIMNVSLMQHPDYRPVFMKRYSIKADTSLLSDKHMATTGYEQSVQEFLVSLAKNSTRPFYVSITVDPMYSNLLKDDLYLTGLANRYSAKRFDNIAVLKRNWDRMHRDYLSEQFYDESYGFNKTWLPLLNMNYVPMMALLCEHYLLSGDETKATHMREFALQLAQQAGQEKETRDYFESLGKESIPFTQNCASPKKTAVVQTAESQPSPLRVAPNPASTRVSISLEGVKNADITITSMQGAVAFTGTMRETELEIDTTQWVSGVYTVRAITAEGSYTSLFTIQR